MISETNRVNIYNKINENVNVVCIRRNGHYVRNVLFRMFCAIQLEINKNIDGRSTYDCGFVLLITRRISHAQYVLSHHIIRSTANLRNKYSQK